MNEITVCENRNVELKCASNLKLDIKYAMFGRVSHNKCRPEFNLNTLIDKCVQDLDVSIGIVKNLCNSKNSCQFNVNKVLLGDPCMNYSKYLDIKYECL